MERGDCRLITEAAVTNVFNFKDGSPLDPEYNIRLKYALSYLLKKRMENAFEVLSIYNMLICIQRTLAGASDLYGEKSKEVLSKCLRLITNTTEDEVKTDSETSEASTIEHFKAIYNKLYGNESNDNSNGNGGTTVSSSNTDE